MKFPSRLLAANIVFALMLAAGFVAVVAVVGTAIAVFTDLDQSVWEQAMQVPRWFVLFAGVSLIREFMPMYLANGQTRRQFAAQAAVAVVLFAPFMSVLAVLGYLGEMGIYHLAAIPHELADAHLFADPGQLHMVFLEYTVEFLIWMAAGAFMGAGFYRWESNGIFTVPIGVAMIVLGGLSGLDLRLPFLWDDLGLAGEPSALIASAGGALITAAGLALTWGIVRDVPLRTVKS